MNFPLQPDIVPTGFIAPWPIGGKVAAKMSLSHVSPTISKLLPLLIPGPTKTPGNDLWKTLAKGGPTFLAELRRGHLTPLLYAEIVRQNRQSFVDPKFLQVLRHDFLCSVRAAAQQEQEAIRVIQSLSAAGIDLILLKGADLRLRVYGDPAVRPMYDLDILVSPSQVDRARGVLESMEFRLHPRYFDPLPGWRARFRDALHFNPPPGWLIRIDLHWQLDRIVTFYRLPYSHLQKMATTAEYQGCAVKVLAPEHLVIHLALNIYGEPQGALKIIDLAGALSLPLNWALFLKEVARFRCERPLFVILQGISRLFPQKVPSWILDRLDQSRPSWVAELALRNSLGPLTVHAVTLYHHRRFSDWFFYLHGLIWPQKEYLTATYGRPDRLLFFRQILASLFSSTKNWGLH